MTLKSAARRCSDALRCRYGCISVLDSAEEKLSDHFETAFGFIEQGVAAGKAHVLVYIYGLLCHVQYFILAASPRG